MFLPKRVAEIYRTKKITIKVRLDNFITSINYDVKYENNALPISYK
jgi:hypothetical protein